MPYHRKLQAVFAPVPDEGELGERDYRMPRRCQSRAVYNDFVDTNCPFW